MDIYDALRESHETQRRLSARLLAKEDDRGQPRHAAFIGLKHELAAHETAEERAFYMPLFEHDETVDPSRHAIAEHHEMDEMVEQLEKMREGAAEWKDLVEKLIAKIEHHLHEEETRFFDAARKVITPEQARGLADRYFEEYNRLIDKEERIDPA
jgi:hypothetical protein